MVWSGEDPKGSSHRGEKELMFPDNIRQFIDGFAPFLEALNEGAIIGGPGAMIYYANDVYCRMVGLTREQLVGRSALELYDKPAQEEFLNILSSLPRGAQSKYEFYVDHPDHGRIPVHVAVGLLGRVPNAPEGLVVVTVTDISELKRAQELVRRQAEELEKQARYLERQVRSRSFELHEANFDAIYMLALAGEARDSDTGAHVRRIQHTSEAIAVELGLEMWEAVEIGYSSILHDIGKMVLSDRILKKNGPLNENERREMQRHTIAGERILGQRGFFETARRIARSHHEAWNGGGYPDGLGRDDIPIAARIVAVADIYDALIHERPYKRAWESDEACRFLEKQAGQHLDPDVTKAFLRLHQEGEVRRLYELVSRLEEEPRLPVQSSGVFRIPSGI